MNLAALLAKFRALLDNTRNGEQRTFDRKRKRSGFLPSGDVNCIHGSFVGAGPSPGALQDRQTPVPRQIENPERAELKGISDLNDTNEDHDGDVSQPVKKRQCSADPGTSEHDIIHQMDEPLMLARSQLVRGRRWRMQPINKSANVAPRSHWNLSPPILSLHDAHHSMSSKHVVLSGIRPYGLPADCFAVPREGPSLPDRLLGNERLVKRTGASIRGSLMASIQSKTAIESDEVLIVEHRSPAKLPMSQISEAEEEQRTLEFQRREQTWRALQRRFEAEIHNDIKFNSKHKQIQARTRHEESKLDLVQEKLKIQEGLRSMRVLRPIDPAACETSPAGKADSSVVDVCSSSDGAAESAKGDTSTDESSEHATSASESEDELRTRVEGLTTAMRLGPRQLTSADLHQYNALMANCSESIVVASNKRSNLIVNGAHMSTMGPQQWLSDECINMYMALLQERDMRWHKGGKDMPRCWFAPTFFLNKLFLDQGYSYDSVRRWTMPKKFQLVKLPYTSIFELDKVILPVHLGNHWTCAVVNLRDQALEYYDSLGHVNRGVIQALARWLEDEHQDKRSEPAPSHLKATEWKVIANPPGTPQQQNGVDCGVFAIVCANYCGAGHVFDYNQRDVYEFLRPNCALEIARQEIAELP